MRNTIPCTAEHIGLLEPSMIQVIVEPKAYQRGHEYFKDSRVRLLEAHDTDIAASVRGNSGVFEQTIRLREGCLVTACTCSLIEQPMCRHCVAVLLEYHRWSSQRGRRDTAAPRAAREGRASNGAKADQAAPARTNGKVPHGQERDARLSDVMAFAQWAQPAMRALLHNDSLPDRPDLPEGMVADWVRAIEEVHGRQQGHEGVRHDLEAQVAQRDGQLQQLSEQLASTREEMEHLRQANARLEQDMLYYQGVISRLKDLTCRIAQFDGDVKAVAGDLGKSQHHLEGLARSFHDVSQALFDLAKPRTP